MADKKPIIITLAESNTNTVTAERIGAHWVISDLSGDDYLLTPAEYNDKNHLNYIIAQFEDFAHFFNFHDDHNADGLLGA